MPGEVTKATLDSLETGLAAILDKIDLLLKAEAYAEKLPVIGTQLGTAGGNAVQTLTLLRGAIVNAIDGLSNLSDLADKSLADIQAELTTRINTALSTLGSGFAGTVTASVTGAQDIVLSFDTGRTTTQSFTPGDLGMSGLGLTMQGSANASLAYNLDFRIGLDSTGVYLDTAGTNISLGANVSLGSLAATAMMGPLKFTASNIADSDPSGAADTLALNITTVFNGSGRLRDMGADILDVRASGDLDLDLHLAADMGNAALPGVSADLHVDWSFSNSLLNGAGANSWSAATVTFDHVKYSFGDFVDTFIAPILDQLEPILKPINEGLSVFRTDISGVLLPDWKSYLDVNHDDKVTLLDLLQKASTVAGLGIDFSPIAQLVDTIDQITDFIEFLSGKHFDDAGYDIGSYTLQLQAIQGAADTLAGLDLDNPSTGTFASAAAGLGGFLNGIAASDADGFGATFQGQTGAQIITNIVGNPILSFPLVENPLSVIKLLLGQDIDLFKFDMPAIDIRLGMNAAGQVTTPIPAAIVPIWPIPLVTAQVGVAAQAKIDLAVGYDTAGLRYWASQGALAGSITDIFTHGFYLDDQRSGSIDLPEIILRAAIDFVIDANFLGVSIGGGGNLTGELILDLADHLTDASGKLHLSDFPAGYGLATAFSIFDVEGAITAGLRGYVNSPFGSIWSYYSPRLTLMNFATKPDATATGTFNANSGGNAPPPPPPPGLADVLAVAGGGTGLWVNIGSRAGERDIANRTDGADVIEIAQSGSNIVVAGFDTSQTFDATTFTSIQIDAGNGADEIILNPGVNVALRASGGAGADYIQGGDANDQIYGGTSDDYLLGGAGNDTLDGEDGNDRLEGGAGSDTLIGGAGDYDTATYAFSSSGITLNLGNPALNAGDAFGDTFVSIEIYEGSGHDDTMIGSQYADIFTGLAGNDTLRGMDGDDILAPGLGANSVDGGAGFDIVNYYNITSPITVTGGSTPGSYTVTAGPAGSPTVNDTLVDVEQIDGSVYGDTMTGGAGDDIFVGREGDDILDGGAGDDTLVGGLGADTLRGGPGDRDRASYILATSGVTASMLNPAVNTGEAIGDTYQDIEGLRGSEYNDTLSGDNAANLLQGGAGDDTLNGNGGADILQGGTGADSLNGGDGKDIASYYNSTTWVVLNLQPGGVDENDAVGDTFSSIEVYQGTRFSDTMTGSDGMEELWGEEGDDRLYGRGGNDTLLGGAGNDELWGDAGEDILEGGAGNDEMHGGADRDTLTGGDNDDTLYGDDGNDVLAGEAGQDTIYGGAGDDSVSGGDDNDTVHGGDDNDGVSGGAGDDTLYGDAGDDNLYGDAGNDTIDGGTGRDRVWYSADPAGVRINLSSTDRVLAGSTVIAFSARDGYGGTDSFAATGNLANVEDVTASQFADVIIANEGGSKIDALGGADVITGLGGDDVIRGGAGDDIIVAGEGNDEVHGGAGADGMQGGGGTDWLSYAEETGGGVTANLKTGLATDSGGATDDFGGFENLRGSNQNDTLTGDDGANVIEGLGGNDVIDGGLGADTMRGGDGDDIIYADSIGPGGDSVLGGDGVDLLRISVDMPSNHGPGTEHVQLIGTARVAAGDGGHNQLMGNALDNIFYGNGGEDTFWGYAGDDTYYFDSLGDTIGVVDGWRALTAGAGEVAGGGNDTVMLATAAIYGGTFQNPTFWTYDLNRSDLVFVENVILTDNDRRVDLVGNAQNNRLVGNDQTRILRGEGGDDILEVGIGDTDTDSGLGDDTLVVDWSRAIYGVDMLVAHTANATLGGWDGDYRMSAYNWFASFVSTEHFHITTGSGDDNIRTADGNDIVRLNDGNDFVNVFAGFDQADGGAGTDGISANYAAETLAIHWDLAANTYSEGTDGTANDKRSFTNFEYFGELVTGSGDDVIVTTTGYRSEVIRTGAGDDRVVFREGDDDFYGGSGFDTLVVDWSHAPYDVDMRVAHTANTTLGGWDGDYRMSAYNWFASFESVERFEITTGSGNDNIRTADNDDIVNLNDGNDFVDVFAGFDHADGGAGHDGISANYAAETLAIHWNLQTNSYSEGADGTANDRRAFANFEYFGTLTTGSGNDVIVTRGSYNSETVNTGAGDDRVTFVSGDDSYNAGSGTDTLVIDWSWSGYGADTQSAPDGTAAGGYAGRYRIGATNNFVTYSGVERFEIGATQGNDMIRTGDNDDIVNLNDGDDFVAIGKGYDHADGGAGHDGITADYAADTLAITWNLQTNVYFEGSDGAANDRRAFANFEYFGELATGSGDDVIVTRGSYNSETIRTGLGNDRVTFVSGDDTVEAGGGTDTLVIDWSWSGYGADSQVAPTANTTLGGYDGRYRIGASNNYVTYSSIERFEISATQSNDSIVTGAGNDIVDLNDGDDFVNIGSGLDRATGGAGHDGISADYSAETLAIHWNLQTDVYFEGNDGTANDLRAFAGFEYFGTLTTGGGNDVIVTRGSYNSETVNTGAGDDRVTFVSGDDSYNAGSGTDTLVIDWSWSGYGLDTQTAPTGNALAGYDGRYRIGASNNFVAYTGVERFEITGTQAGDTIVTGDNDDIVNAGGGDDVLNLGGGRDEADGGAGNDRISANYGTDTTAILWDLQANTYSGGGRAFANFEMFGTLTTGSGNDVIVTDRLGADETINTGDGDDRVKFLSGNDTFNAGAGDDTLVIDWSANLYGTDSYGFAATAGGGWNGTFRIGATGWYVGFTGVEHFDITLGSANDVIATRDGNDVVRLGGGNDFVDIGSGLDTADGGAGRDGISADYRSETVAIRWDLVANTYSEGNDGTANDRRAFTNFEYFGTLRTGSGNDVIVTGTGYNSEAIYTGDGDDRVTFREGDDDFYAGLGTDTLVLDWSHSNYGADMRVNPTANATLGGWDGDFRMSAYNWFASFESVERFEINATQGDDNLRTADGDDIVYLNAGNDYVETRGGNDFIDGGAGDDTLRGGTGNDVYIVDSLGDVVIEEAGEGTDEIRTTLASYSIAALANVENLTGIGTTAGQILTGNGGDNVLTGSSFGDMLKGGAGDDQLLGGDGNDFLFAGSGANDQLFGGNGIDTVVLDGSPADWQFTDLGDGRVRLRDLRDATGQTNAYLTSIERVEFVNGSVTLAEALAGNFSTIVPGTTGNDVIVVTTPGVIVNLGQGGTDHVTGSAGDDLLLFLGALDPTDQIDAGNGVDQIGLLGNYDLTLGSNIVGTEFLAILSGSDTRFGEDGSHRYSYRLTTTDATVAAGTQYYVQANALLPGENLFFDGSAETDGSFFFAGGQGTETLKGGAGNDRAFFGENGRFGAGDSFDGGAGTDDQMGLRGDYGAPIVFGATTMVNTEMLVLLSSTDTRFGNAATPYNYNITTHDANVAAGARLAISANTLTVSEHVTFDGSAETDGYFFFIGGAGHDSFKGGAGNDAIFGGLGGDTLTGGAGADTYIYLTTGDSTAMARDSITDFASGDRIDLSRIDAVAGTPGSSFSFVGSAFTGAAGQLRAFQSGASWIVEGDSDGDGLADLSIMLTSDHAITAADFIL